jgi:hypothetical protein
VAWAEFAEREYETAANVEIANGGATLHTPPQVLEKLLGYDAAASPATDYVWRVIGTVCRGVTEESLEAVLDFAAVAEFTSRAAATWWIRAY